ncbi:ABC transporter permease [Actinokineospora sp. NBRC 105648]|uniref:ABC transporter permease n=1 Tax=Actinokineospora sp. NBRC 105648 TaxID=3032206 RepID=UPI00249F95E3|nr:ABC transporter permease [Actinokineospora sp. NBRC 105648]GLZ42285.1 sugar ABC transporter permease [Actinokineospora sp. NBRC 105648]
MSDAPRTDELPDVETVPDRAPRRGPRLGQQADVAIQGVFLSAFLVAIIVYFANRADNFLTADNGITILATAAVIGIVSIGQVTTIISGGFDLSVSGVVPIGSVLYALLLNDGVSIPAALGLVLLTGCAVGLVNGFVITVMGVNPLIATLGTMSIAGGVALTLAKGVSIPFDDVDADALTRESLWGVPNHVWILLGLGVLVFGLLRFTVYGRQLYAVGGSPEASRLAGMRTRVVTSGAYVLSGTLAALAGAIISSQLLTGVAGAGSDSALQSIAAVVLGGAALTGGVGGITGTFVGVIILATLSNGMAILQVPSFYQQIATGAVLLVAVALSRLTQTLRNR